MEREREIIYNLQLIYNLPNFNLAHFHCFKSGEVGRRSYACTARTIYRNGHFGHKCLKHHYIADNTDIGAKTNDFYDFVLEYYDQFMSEEYILLSTAWTWYKKYVEDANSYSKMPRRAFATELSTYFESGPLDEWYLEDGVRKHLSSVYRGFKHDKFKNIKQTRRYAKVLAQDVRNDFEMVGAKLKK